MQHDGVKWICGYQLKINEDGEVIAVSKTSTLQTGVYPEWNLLKGFPYAGIQQEGIFFRRKLLETVDLEALKRFRRAATIFFGRSSPSMPSCILF